MNRRFARCVAGCRKRKTKSLDPVSGELTELTAENSHWAWAKTKSLAQVMKQVKSRADLYEIAKVRNYRKGWVFTKRRS